MKGLDIVAQALFWPYFGYRVYSYYESGKEKIKRGLGGVPKMAFISSIVSCLCSVIGDSFTKGHIWTQEYQLINVVETHNNFPKVYILLLPTSPFISVPSYFLLEGKEKVFTEFRSSPSMKIEGKVIKETEKGLKLDTTAFYNSKIVFANNAYDLRKVKGGSTEEKVTKAVYDVLLEEVSKEIEVYNKMKNID
mgnify:CR=1 FL=1